MLGATHREKNANTLVRSRSLPKRMFQKPLFRSMSKQMHKKAISNLQNHSSLGYPVSPQSYYTGALFQYGSHFHEASNKLLKFSESRKESLTLPKVHNENSYDVPHFASNSKYDFEPYLYEKRKRATSIRRCQSLPMCFQEKDFNAISTSPLIFGELKCSEDISVNKNVNLFNVVKKSNSILEKVTRTRKGSFSRKDSNCSEKLEFDNLLLENLISNVLKKYINSKTYNSSLSNKRSRHLSKLLEDMVRLRLINSNDKYKIVAHVFLGELKDYGLSFATQCSYHPTEDFFASSTSQSEDIFVCAIVTAMKCDEGLF
ncbi:uncharacterized protein LOC105849285 [Hydra vulgaris]|uniref:uncharacterized protein LOC105849285 n=1 Tax=Hydra vulgaris TaxID=6087 RepID=UPI000640D93B|nr:uncharacterized protein LOC105849285 [Hydra vulgaris]